MRSAISPGGALFRSQPMISDAAYKFITIVLFVASSLTLSPYFAVANSTMRQAHPEIVRASPLTDGAGLKQPGLDSKLDMAIPEGRLVDVIKDPLWYEDEREKLQWLLGSVRGSVGNLAAPPMVNSLPNPYGQDRPLISWKEPVGPVSRSRFSEARQWLKRFPAMWNLAPD